MPEQYNNQIENRDLAHTMALAEVPQREIAATALKVGDMDTHKKALKKAGMLGVQAGKAYLQEMAASLDFHEKELLDSERRVHATFEELDAFARSKWQPSGNKYVSDNRKHIATRSWNTMMRGKNVFDDHGLEDVLIYEPAAHGKSTRLFNPRATGIILDERVIAVLPELYDFGKLSQDLVQSYYQAKLVESSKESTE